MKKSTFKAVLILLIVSLLFAFPIQFVLRGQLQFFNVSYVIDGDTIDLENGDRIRYLGVDTPETVDPLKAVQCYGKEASEFNRKLVEGKKVEVSFEGQDQRGRKLAYVYLEDGTFVNAELLKHGYARAYRAQNTMYSQMFLELEQTAKAAGRGLWSIEGRLHWLDEQRQSMYLEMSRMQAQIADLMDRITALEGGKTFSPPEPDIEKEPDQAKLEDDEIVYITKGGKKYHRGGCWLTDKSSRNSFPYV